MSDKKHRQQILEALARYQRKGRVYIDEGIINHMLAEESDRGLVIILTSWIEDMLLDRILENLPPMNESRQKTLTKAGGPLKDFATRTAMARAMEIIDDDMLETLDVFRAMRNACAHSRHNITFKTPELKATLLLLLSGEAEEVVQETDDETMLQIAFICAAGFTLGVLSGEPHEDAERRINVFVANVTAEARAEAAELTASEETQSDTPTLGSHWLHKV